VSIGRGGLFFFAVWAALCGIIAVSGLGAEGLFTHAEQKLQILDFAYHWAIVRGFWFDGTGGISTPNQISMALTSLLGTPPPAVMPNPMSPTLVVVWLPLVLFPVSLLREAYIVWLSCSVAVCAVALVVTIGSKLTRKQCWYSALPIFFIVASPVFQNGVILGQTTVCALGVATLLVWNLLNTERTRFCSDLFAALSLLVLSIKAPYLFIGVGLLGLFHRWRAILLGGALGAVVLAVASEWAQPGWLVEYGAVMRQYSVRDFTDGGFVWADYGGGTPTVTNILRGLVSEEVIGGITSGAAVFAAVILAFLCVRFDWRSRGRTLLVGCTTIIGTYLLFSPYLGGYEDLFILLPVAVLYVVGESPAGNYRRSAALVVAVLSLWSEVFPVDVGVLLKALALLLILLACNPAGVKTRFYESRPTSSP